MKHAQVLLLQRLEVIVELLVPRVQDEDLEAQRRGANSEVGERETTRDQHLCGGSHKHGMGVQRSRFGGRMGC